jgi:hypothetical protein
MVSAALAPGTMDRVGCVTFLCGCDVACHLHETLKLWPWTPLEQRSSSRRHVEEDVDMQLEVAVASQTRGRHAKLFRYI